MTFKTITILIIVLVVSKIANCKITVHIRESINVFKLIFSYKSISNITNNINVSQYDDIIASKCVPNILYYRKYYIIILHCDKFL